MVDDGDSLLAGGSDRGWCGGGLLRGGESWSGYLFGHAGDRAGPAE